MRVSPRPWTLKTTTDLVADVEGYYVDSGAGSYFLANSPKRLLDTRSGAGGTTGPVQPGHIVTLNVPNCVSGGTSVPATAVALNVTAVAPSANGYVTVYPDQGTVPLASNLNHGTGQNTPNLVVVGVGADGKIDLYNGSSGIVQFVADLEGCYSSSLGGSFVPVVPFRSLDTRIGLGQYAKGPAGPDLNVSWDLSIEDPNIDAVAESGFVINVTVTQPKASGYITAIGELNPPPATTSVLNFRAGQTVPNLVMVGRYPALYNASKGSTQLIVDMFGYFS